MKRRGFFGALFAAPMAVKAAMEAKPAAETPAQETTPQAVIRATSDETFNDQFITAYGLSSCVSVGFDSIYRTNRLFLTDRMK